MSVSMREEEEGGARSSSLPAESVAIARRLALSGKRVIGFLPVLGPRSRGPSGVLSAVRGSMRGSESVAPDVLQDLVEDLAASLIEFVAGNVGVIGHWRRTPAGDVPPLPPATRVVRIVPLPTDDRARASFELRRTIALHAEGAEGDQPSSRILVNLSDYASPGVIPSAVDWMDGVALVVPLRRTRWRRVAEMVRGLEHEKQLGVIVVGR